MKKFFIFPFLLCLLLTGCTGSARRPLPGFDPATADKNTDLSDSEEKLSEPESTDSPSTDPAYTRDEPSPSSEMLSSDPLPEASSPEPESEQLNALADEILLPSMSEYEKVKAIHDYLVTHVNYDYENLAAGTLPDTAFTKEGALLLHSAVCEGYAKAFSWLCKEAGIKEQLVYGTANDGTGVQPHAWNQVCVDGEWYYVDVTWDDPLIDGEVVSDGSNLIYDYFLVPGMTLLGNHTAEAPETLHECTSERYLEQNRLLTIEPYLTEPYSFTGSDAEIREAVERYLAEGTHVFRLICDITYHTPEGRSNLVLEHVKDTMAARQEYGQISVETQYGVANYAVICVTITQ